MRQSIVVASALFVFVFAAGSALAGPSITAAWTPEIPDHVENPGGIFVADCVVDPGNSTPDVLSVSLVGSDGNNPIFHIDLPGGVEYHLEWEAPVGIEDGVYHYEVEYHSQEGDVATLRGGFLVLGQFNTLCAVKFHDADGDGAYEPDDGETLLPGWEFCGTGVIDLGCEFTDEDGVACWFDIPEGDYELCETLMAGWEPTTQEGLCQGSFVGADDIIKLVFGNRETGPVATEQTTWGQIKNIYK